MTDYDFFFFFFQSTDPLELSLSLRAKTFRSDRFDRVFGSHFAKRTKTKDGGNLDDDDAYVERELLFLNITKTDIDKVQARSR